MYQNILPNIVQETIRQHRTSYMFMRISESIQELKEIGKPIAIKQKDQEQMSCWDSW